MNKERKYRAIGAHKDLSLSGMYVYYSENFPSLAHFFRAFCSPNKSYIINDWIGIQDKNGKDIYEHDIVRHRLAIVRQNHWFNGVAVYVKAYNNCAYALEENLRASSWGHFISNCYDLEVIGNIHENPELLIQEDPEC